MNSGTDIGKAADILKKGGLVAIPTETVYGLAADATNPEAVARIFEVKKRPSFDPLIIHLYDAGSVMAYAKLENNIAKKLSDYFWPGPLTQVLPKRDTIPSLVSSGLDTVGVRVPSHPLTRELLNKVNLPLAAPSANLFGYVSPTRAAHVLDQLGSEVDYVLDGGACSVGLESTIIGFENNMPVVFRKGGIEIEKIEAVIGKVFIREHSSSNPKAPGMLSNHYSPHKLLMNLSYEKARERFPDKVIGALVFGSDLEGCPSQYQLNLSNRANVHEAAYNLFDLLRKMDSMKPDIFIFNYLPNEGIAQAINDRLKRASVD